MIREQADRECSEIAEATQHTGVLTGGKPVE